MTAPLSARPSLERVRKPPPALSDTASQPEAAAYGPNSARGPSAASRRSSAVSRGDGAQRVPLTAREQVLGKKEFEARRKRNEHVAKHGKLQDGRQQDDKNIQEKIARSVQEREKRFEGMLERIRQDQQVRIAAAKHIHNFELEEEKRRADLYQKWDNEVYQRVDANLNRFLTDSVPAPSEDGWREELRHDDCPMKHEMRQQAKEEKFHRIANAIINTGTSQVSMQEDIRQREKVEGLIRERGKSRPVLPPELWAQQHQYASPNGHFAQACERDSQGLGFHTSRRMGPNAHLPDERDGIPMAGKTKVRFERNCLGMLAGDLATRGEAARYKQEHGASSGAPCQDHYDYAVGNAIVDAEFPVGKRYYPKLRM
eukprot:TRINITY_DN14728_c1_g1_i1.p1 TRINITY_DN14728_c1_g1~~TRINITY_DN14728_c1_g1_i1.p1  ORF type:complete len:401 (-),score=80.00 TRINITY_DN14728_c1_g1_i1:55-1167(-)